MSWWQDYGLNKINYKMLVYIFLVIIIIVSSGNYLYKSERTVSAVFCSILFILIFVFFGQRWFNNSNSPTGIPTPKTWPPVINTCPDYLTYYNAGGTPNCIDLIGITNSQYNSIFNSWTSDDVTNPPPSSASNKFFPAVYQAGKTDMTSTCSNTSCSGKGDNMNSKYYLNQLCIARGLSWEGITN
jgi:hypothetical protein